MAANPGDLAVIREAILAALDEQAAYFGRLVGPKAARVAARLHRRRLGWLMAPWFLVSLVRGLPTAFRPPPWPCERHAIRRYAEASGQDLDLAETEVRRIMLQLMALHEGMPGHCYDDDRPKLAPVTRAELALAADALVRFHLAGRHTDDPLLAEVQATWNASDRFSREFAHAVGEHGFREARRRERASRQQEQEARDRVREAWQRWLDQQQAKGEG
jgi:hypothetical protein